MPGIARTNIGRQIPATARGRQIPASAAKIRATTGRPATTCGEIAENSSRVQDQWWTRTPAN
eukprot:13685833-Heterocapsa_arctica.AAC.1